MSFLNKYMTKNILIGKIVSAFGIKGEVKIISYAEEPQKIEKYNLFDKDGNPLKLKISNKNKAAIGTSNNGTIFIAKLDGVNDRNASELLRDKEIFVSRNDFDKTKKNEFYYVDLIGLVVVDMHDNKIGKVVDVQDHGAGGMLEIKFDTEDKKNNLGKIENFAFKNKIFPEVNLKEGFIRFDAPEIVIAKEI